MKTAELQILNVEFTCPGCGENLCAPDGSFMFALTEIPAQLKCTCCGLDLKVPAKAKKLAAGITK